MSLSKDLGIWRVSLPAAMCLCAIILTTTSVHAQNRRNFCTQYAEQAVEDSEINQRRNCGFKGPRWDENGTAHFGWCMIFPRQAEDEGEARKAQLKECRQDRREERVGKRANCETYAKIAVVQADANKKYDCGYRGGEWVAEERPHMRWCMRAKRDYLIDEIRFRSNELQKCFNKLGDYDDDEGEREYKRRRF